MDDRNYYLETQKILARFGIIVDLKSDYLMEITHESYIVMAEKKISFFKALMQVKSKQWYARKTTPTIDSIDHVTLSNNDDNFQAVENKNTIENYRQKVINKSQSNKQRKLNQIDAILAEMEI